MEGLYILLSREKNWIGIPRLGQEITDAGVEHLLQSAPTSIFHLVHQTIISNKFHENLFMGYLNNRQEQLCRCRGIHTTHFVSRNNKSDLQAHSRSLVFMPFDKPYVISYYSCIVTVSLLSILHHFQDIISYFPTFQDVT